MSHVVNLGEQVVV